MREGAPPLDPDAPRAHPSSRSGRRAGRAHADHPARRRRLWHVAVRAQRRARGDARVDELHQPRAWRLRHARRLCHGAADEPRRRAVPGDAAGSPSSSRRWSASCWSARSIGGSTARARSIRCCSPSAWCSWRCRPPTICSAISRSRSTCRPSCKAGSIFSGVGIGVYRLFTIALCGAIAAALQIFLVGTRFGARLRAAVDDPRTAAGLGINVDLLFAVTFAVGSGLAGLGGALAVDVVGGIDPSFPQKYLVIMLIVVDDRRPERHPRRSVRRAAARRARCRRQILRAFDRRLHHLCA